jgi:hypothetical protein
VATTPVEDPEAYFLQQADLHDARITRLVLQRTTGMLTIGLDDVNSGLFAGSDASQPSPVDLHFLDAKLVEIDIAHICGVVSIYAAEVKPCAGRYLMQLQLAPSGSVQFTFGSVHVSDSA